MKRTTAIIAAALVALGGLTACSSSSEPYKVTVASDAPPPSEVVEEEVYVPDQRTLEDNLQGLWYALPSTFTHDMCVVYNGGAGWTVAGSFQREIARVAPDWGPYLDERTVELFLSTHC